MLFLYELDTAVLGTAFVGAVVGYRFVAAFSYRAEVERIDAFFFKCGNYGLGTLLAEGVVDGIAALVVGMALNLEAG